MLNIISHTDLHLRFVFQVSLNSMREREGGREGGREIGRERDRARNTFKGNNNI